MLRQRDGPEPREAVFSSIRRVLHSYRKDVFGTHDSESQVRSDRSENLASGRKRPAYSEISVRMLGFTLCLPGPVYHAITIHNWVTTGITIRAALKLSAVTHMVRQL